LTGEARPSSSARKAPIVHARIASISQRPGPHAYLLCLAPRFLDLFGKPSSWTRRRVMRTPVALLVNTRNVEVCRIDCLPFSRLDPGPASADRSRGPLRRPLDLSREAAADAIEFTDPLDSRPTQRLVDPRFPHLRTHRPQTWRPRAQPAMLDPGGRLATCVVLSVKRPPVIPGTTWPLALGLCPPRANNPTLRHDR
jgi:hypothetical protein